MTHTIAALALLLAASAAQAQQCFPGSTIGNNGCVCDSDGTCTFSVPSGWNGSASWNGILPNAGSTVTVSGPYTVPMTCHFDTSGNLTDCKVDHSDEELIGKRANQLLWWRTCMKSVKCWAWLRPY